MSFTLSMSLEYSLLCVLCDKSGKIKKYTKISKLVYWYIYTEMRHRIGDVYIHKYTAAAALLVSKAAGAVTVVSSSKLPTTPNLTIWKKQEEEESTNYDSNLSNIIDGTLIIHNLFHQPKLTPLTLINFPHISRYAVQIASYGTL